MLEKASSGAWGPCHGATVSLHMRCLFTRRGPFSVDFHTLCPKDLLFLLPVVIMSEHSASRRKIESLLSLWLAFSAPVINPAESELRVMCWGGGHLRIGSLGVRRAVCD